MPKIVDGIEYLTYEEAAATIPLTRDSFAAAVSYPSYAVPVYKFPHDKRRYVRTDDVQWYKINGRVPVDRWPADTTPFLYRRADGSRTDEPPGTTHRTEIPKAAANIIGQTIPSLHAAADQVPEDLKPSLRMLSVVSAYLATGEIDEYFLYKIREDPAMQPLRRAIARLAAELLKAGD